MEKRIGAIAIVVTDTSSVNKINEILSNHASLIIGRMGIPRKDKSLNIISLIVEGNTDDLGSLTGKLGRISGVEAKSVLTKYKEES